MTLKYSAVSPMYNSEIESKRITGNSYENLHTQNCKSYVPVTPPTKTTNYFI